ncbi:MAG: hypothetical protein JW863_02985 [Chitinispirillaceae bacterium]|nr:hypothetical protein [Chitinispirillaceae bacterium]
MKSVSGHPLAIEMLASSISEDFIVEIQSEPIVEHLTVEEIANKIVKKIYQRFIKDNERSCTDILKTISIAKESIGLNAIERISGLKSQDIFRWNKYLLARNLIYKPSQDKYDSHALVREFIVNTMEESEKNKLNRNTAAYYFDQAINSKPSNIDLFINSFLFGLQHLLDASDFKETANKIVEYDFDILLYERGDHYKLLDIYDRIIDDRLPTDLLARFKGNKARIYRDLQKFELSKSIAEDSLKLARTCGNNHVLIEELINCGDILHYCSLNDKSFELLNEAITHNIFTEIDKKLAGRAYGCIGNVYGNKNEELKAIEYYQKAILLAEDAGDKRYISIWTGDIAIQYGKNNEYKKAKPLFEKAIQLAELSGDKRLLSTWSTQLANINCKENNIECAIDRYILSLKLDILNGYTNNIRFTIKGIMDLCKTQNTPEIINKILKVVNSDISEKHHIQISLLPFLYILGEEVCLEAKRLEMNKQRKEAVEEYSKYLDIHLIEFYIRARRAFCFRFYPCTSIEEKKEYLQMALEEYDKVIQIYPEDGEYYMLRAAVLSQAGGFTGAIDGYDKAIALNPNNIMAVLGKVEALICLGTHDEAYAILQDIVGKEMPSHYKAISIFLYCITRAIQMKPIDIYLSNLEAMDAKLSWQNDWCTEEIDGYIERLQSTKPVQLINKLKNINNIFKSKFVEQ